MGKYREDREERDEKPSMTPEQARAFRASLFVEPKKILSEAQRKEQFKLFWAQSRKKYGAIKGLENALWVHLKTIKHDEPEKFEAGIKHFGLKKKVS